MNRVQEGRYLRHQKFQHHRRGRWRDLPDGGRWAMDHLYPSLLEPKRAFKHVDLDEKWGIASPSYQTRTWLSTLAKVEGKPGVPTE